MGVGSGILSLAAALLGAEYVLGVDVDADAVAIAQENVRVNVLLFPERTDLQKRIELRVGSLDILPIRQTFDRVLMNIRPNVILSLMPYAAGLLQTGGKLILSGILEEEGPELLDNLRSFEFVLQHQLVADGWIAYLLSRNA